MYYLLSYSQVLYSRCSLVWMRITLERHNPLQVEPSVLGQSAALAYGSLSGRIANSFVGAYPEGSLVIIDELSNATLLPAVRE